MVNIPRLLSFFIMCVWMHQFIIQHGCQVHFSFYINVYGYRNALLGIVGKGGFSSLYAGWGAVLCRNVPHSVIKVR